MTINAPAFCLITFIYYTIFSFVLVVSGSVLFGPLYLIVYLVYVEGLR
jgi:hypothetical protein